MEGMSPLSEYSMVSSLCNSVWWRRDKSVAGQQINAFNSNCRQLQWLNVVQLPPRVLFKDNTLSWMAIYFCTVIFKRYFECVAKQADGKKCCHRFEKKNETMYFMTNMYIFLRCELIALWDHICDVGFSQCTAQHMTHDGLILCCVQHLSLQTFKPAGCISVAGSGYCTDVHQWTF